LRIKFKKGMTPESIALAFLDIMRRRKTIIGAVNIYVQEYGEDMKVFEFDDECIVVEPTREGMRQYADYSAAHRRSRIKVV